RCPDEHLPVRTEHGEAVEGSVGGYLLDPCSVRIDEKNVEVAEFGVGVVVGREDNLAAVRGPGWSEAGATQMGDLALVGAVCVHRPQVHLVRTYETLGEQRLVVGEVFRIGWMECAIDDLFSIGRPP